LELLREGIAAARAGDKPRTRQLLSQSTALDPTNEIAWLWYAGVTDSPAEALRFLEKVLQINPRNERALTGIKTVRLQAGIAAAKAQDRSGARDLLRLVVAEEPRNEVALMWLAGVTDSPEEALGYLLRVLEINPNNERAKSGVTYYQNKIPKAPPVTPAPEPLSPPPISLEKSSAVWICPFCSTGAEVKLNRCPNCRAIQVPHQINLETFTPDVDREKIRTAVMKLTMQLRTKPDYASNYNLGLACLNLGRIDESIHHFTAALRFQPDNEALDVFLQQLEQRKTTPERASIRVPAKSNPVVAGAMRPPTPKPLSSDSGSKRMILVVDDSPTIRKLVAMTMIKNGYRVVEASEGNEAVTRMQEQGTPDLVLLDINMPGMDGYTLCKLIRQKPETSKIPVIMLSGKDGFYNKIRGKMAGSTLYLTKPFQPDALLKVVQKYCPADGMAVTA
jgi:twitching motility two-component system response regulator PilG